MKALVYKDLVAIWKYCRNYLFLCAVFLVLSVFLEEYSFLQMYPAVFIGTLVSTLIAYDERDKWDRQVLTMPVTRRQYVTAKYLVGLILQGTMVILSAVACALRLTMGDGFEWEVFKDYLAFLVGLAAASPSLTLPFVFKNGSEKGRMAYLVILGIIFGLAVGGTMVLKKMNLLQNQMQIPGALLLVVLVPLLYLGSWALSVRWYEKREF